MYGHHENRIFSSYLTIVLLLKIKSGTMKVYNLNEFAFILLLYFHLNFVSIITCKNNRQGFDSLNVLTKLFFVVCLRTSYKTCLNSFCYDDCKLANFISPLIPPGVYISSFYSAILRTTICLHTSK